MKRWPIRRFVFLLLLARAVASRAQTDRTDTLILQKLREHKIPGLQLAVVHKGEIIKWGNYGWANLQDSIPVSDKTVFTINSITKAFTGVALMQLAEAFKLNLNDPVSKYLRDLPLNWRQIRIHQLLSHTSGLPDIIDPEESTLIASEPEEAWAKLIAMPVLHKAGERFVYNQTNYLLLGRIIDTVSGMPFINFIQKEQLQKIPMPKTLASGFGASRDLVPNAAVGYRYSRGKLVNTYFAFPPVLQSAAGMSSTAREMAEWIIALQNFTLLKKPETLQRMWTAAKLNNGETGGFDSLLNGYGAGWVIVSRAKHPAYAAVGGGKSALFIYPEDDLSIIILTNLNGAFPERFIDQIASLYFND